jgi:hypothetical protein
MVVVALSRDDAVIAILGDTNLLTIWVALPEVLMGTSLMMGFIF